jgi:hypothetical protein
MRPFWVVVGVRIGFWAATLVALLWSPLRGGFPEFAAYGARSDFAFNAFARWDAGWFLGIAQHGYTVEQSASFFPLFPLLTRALAFVVRSHLVAAVSISLLSAGVAAIAIGRIAGLTAGERYTGDSVLFYALYPIAFVFTAAYSDGLFVALAAWAFLSAMRGRVLVAALLGGAAVLARPTGIALLPALALLLWPERHAASAWLRRSPLLLLPAALVAYCLYLRSHFGDAFAFAHSEGTFWLRHVSRAGPFGGMWDALRSGEQGVAQIVLHLPARSGAPAGFPKPEEFAVWNVVQAALLLAACALTWVCWKRVSRAAAVYSAGTIVLFLSVPAAVVPLVSEPRFLIGDFPLFIALAVVAARSGRLRTALTVSFGALGLLAAVGFAHGVWVS